jgi:hypothetical protein
MDPYGTLLAFLEMILLILAIILVMSARILLSTQTPMVPLSPLVSQSFFLLKSQCGRFFPLYKP